MPTFLFLLVVQVGMQGGLAGPYRARACGIFWKPAGFGTLLATPVRVSLIVHGSNRDGKSFRQVMATATEAVGEKNR
jgi:hypothetical protein